VKPVKDDIDMAARHADIVRRFPRTLGRLRLSELLDGMSQDRHGEIDVGPPVGREFGAEGWGGLG
jgi:hypothetical protein